jgi:hypothetical protein
MKRREFRSAIIPSDIVRSTTRGFLYPLGEDDYHIQRRRIAVIHTGGGMSPCNTAFREQAQFCLTSDNATEEISFGAKGLFRAAEEVHAHTPLLSLARSLYAKAATRSDVGFAADISTIVGLFEPRVTCSTSS